MPRRRRRGRQRGIAIFTVGLGGTEAPPSPRKRDALSPIRTRGQSQISTTICFGPGRHHRRRQCVGTTTYDWAPCQDHLSKIRRATSETTGAASWSDTRGSDRRSWLSSSPPCSAAAAWPRVPQSKGQGLKGSGFRFGVQHSKRSGRPVQQQVNRKSKRRKKKNWKLSMCFPNHKFSPFAIIRFCSPCACASLTIRFCPLALCMHSTSIPCACGHSLRPLPCFLRCPCCPGADQCTDGRPSSLSRILRCLFRYRSAGARQPRTSTGWVATRRPPKPIRKPSRAWARFQRSLHQLPLLGRPFQAADIFSHWPKMPIPPLSRSQYNAGCALVRTSNKPHYPPMPPRERGPAERAGKSPTGLAHTPISESPFEPGGRQQLPDAREQPKLSRLMSRYNRRLPARRRTAPNQRSISQRWPGSNPTPRRPTSKVRKARSPSSRNTSSIPPGPPSHLPDDHQSPAAQVNAGSPAASRGHRQYHAGIACHFSCGSRQVPISPPAAPRAVARHLKTSPPSSLLQEDICNPIAERRDLHHQRPNSSRGKPRRWSDAYFQDRLPRPFHRKAPPTTEPNSQHQQPTTNAAQSLRSGEAPSLA